MEERKRPGRPRSDNPKQNRIFVLADDETKQQLNECAMALHITNSEVVRMGIRKIHKDIKRKKL